MTKDDIIKLAKEAGLTKGQHWNKQNMTTAFMSDFANLVAAHKAEVITAEAYRSGYEAGVVAEREACAKMCESQEYEYWRDTEDQDFTPQDCADAIRARGTT